MTTTTLAGATVEVDSEGFLADPVSYTHLLTSHLPGEFR